MLLRPVIIRTTVITTSITTVVKSMGVMRNSVLGTSTFDHLPRKC